MKKKLVFITILSCVLISAQAQDRINLTAGQFDVQSVNSGGVTENMLSDWPVFNQVRYGILHLEIYPNLEQQKELEVQGIELLSFLPPHFYLVALSSGSDLKTLNQYSVSSAAPYLVEFKSNIDTSFPPSRAITDEGKLLVNLHPFSNIELRSLVSSLGEAYEIIDTRETYHFITVESDPEGLQELLENSAVQTIDWAYDYGEPENYTGRTAHRSNVLSSDNSNGLNFDGNGVSVMLQDDGMIGPHIDHEGRIGAQFWSGNDGDHGDHVGGTIAGAGNINPNNAGQAKGADLYVYKAAPEYQGYDSISNHYNTLGVVITSTSYSNGCNAGYTSLARTMDQQVFGLPSLMHVFSAGNSGTSDCGYGAGNVWGNITGGHKVGKNVMTVANLNEYDLIASSSSRGPAHDGRIKPDISAKGTNVTSTIENNEYGIKSGTSMSCPGVSGTLAQLYDGYQSLNGSLPDGGLIKAIILNTADDLGNPGPDFIHGWGRINARKAYQLIEGNNIINGSASQGQLINHSINVPLGTSKARFMVYWTDPAAAINASTALINDIDIVVVSPLGDTLLPWVLDPTPNPATLGNPATNGQDHLNNVEQVELNNPETGSYTVVVNGGSIPVGPQDYYLVYWLETEPFVITYPVGGESFTPFTTEVIRWDATNDSVNISLEYSSDGGISWNLINASVNPSQGYFAWTVPFLSSGACKIKVTQGSLEYENAEFSIMPITSNLAVDWACPDSIGLSWSGPASATSFDIYALGDKYMDSIGTSVSLNFVDYYSNPMSDKLWYSVSADGPSSAKSKRQIAIQKAPGVFNCFLPIDLGVEAITPLSSSLYPCHDDQKLGFIVRNFGDAPALSVSATAFIQGVQFANETFTINLAPNEFDTLYFSDTVMFQGGLSEVEVSILFSGDLNSFNDTIQASYFQVDEGSIEPIWVESFDSYANCSDNADCGLTSCTIPNAWTNELNGIFDDIDWRVFSGSTFSAGTGPSGDHTSGTGKYIYLESSGTCDQNQANLISPCVDLSTASAAVLSFYYHMNGIDMGELHVDVYDGHVWTLDVMPSIMGNQGSLWRYQTVDLTSFSGKFINIRFRGITGIGFRSDMALDDINIAHMPIADFEYFTQTDGQTVLFTDQSQYGTNMSFILGDGSTTLSAVPSSHIYNQQMAYDVTQIVSNEVGSDTMTKQIMNLGLAQSIGEKVSIYPNPVKDILHIHLTSAADFVEIYSSDGRLLLSSWLNGSLDHSLNLEGFLNGVYFIKLSGDAEEHIPFLLTR